MIHTITCKPYPPRSGPDSSNENFTYPFKDGQTPPPPERALDKYIHE